MTLKDLFDMIKKQEKLYNSKIGKKLISKEEEIKDKIIEEHQAQKKKDKGPEIDRDKLNIKFPDYIVGEVVRFVLKDALYKNKGLIYDNFPKSEKQAKRLFFSIKGEGDHEDEEGFLDNLH